MIEYLSHEIIFSIFQYLSKIDLFNLMTLKYRKYVQLYFCHLSCTRKFIKCIKCINFIIINLPPHEIIPLVNIQNKLNIHNQFVIDFLKIEDIILRGEIKLKAHHNLSKNILPKISSLVYNNPVTQIYNIDNYAPYYIQSEERSWNIYEVAVHECKCISYFTNNIFLSYLFKLENKIYRRNNRIPKKFNLKLIQELILTTYNYGITPCDNCTNYINFNIFSQSLKLTYLICKC